MPPIKQPSLPPSGSDPPPPRYILSDPCATKVTKATLLFLTNSGPSICSTPPDGGKCAFENLLNVSGGAAGSVGLQFK